MNRLSSQIVALLLLVGGIGLYASSSPSVWAQSVSRQEKKLTPSVTAAHFPFEKADDLMYRLLGFHVEETPYGLQIRQLRHNSPAEQIGFEWVDRILGLPGI